MIRRRSQSSRRKPRGPLTLSERNGYDRGRKRSAFCESNGDWFGREREDAPPIGSGEAMQVNRSQLEGHNLQKALDELHADVYRHNMAPYWVVDRTKLHDEDSQVMDKRKAIPFIWTY